jgi:hypothetical protein
MIRLSLVSILWWSDTVQRERVFQAPNNPKESSMRIAMYFVVFLSLLFLAGCAGSSSSSSGKGENVDQLMEKMQTARNERDEKLEKNPTKSLEIANEFQPRFDAIYASVDKLNDADKKKFYDKYPKKK